MANESRMTGAELQAKALRKELESLHDDPGGYSRAELLGYVSACKELGIDFFDPTFGSDYTSKRLKVLLGVEPPDAKHTYVLGEDD